MSEFTSSLAQFLGDRNSIGMFHTCGETVIPTPEWTFVDSQLGHLLYRYNQGKQYPYQRFWSIQSLDKSVDARIEFPLPVDYRAQVPQRQVQITATDLVAKPIDPRNFSLNVKLPDLINQNSHQIDITLNFFDGTSDAQASVEYRPFTTPSAVFSGYFKEISGIWELAYSTTVADIHTKMAIDSLIYAENTAWRLFTTAWQQSNVRATVGFSWS